MSRPYLVPDPGSPPPAGDAASAVTPAAAELPAGAVAVVGMAGRFPGAADVEELWANLTAGVESIRRFDADQARAAGVSEERLDDPRWVRAGGVLDDPARFDAALFGISPREAEIMDPQHRLLLETAWAALEDAGYGAGAPVLEAAGSARVGVYAGAGQPAYLLDHVHPRLGHGDDFATAYALALGNDKDFLATRISYRLDLTGPSLAVGTACSTSLVAVCLAASALATGDCDLALAGGVTLRLPQERGYPFQEDGILSPDGHCRPFDAEARGTVPGSGVGMVVLKRLEDAVADGDAVRAVIRGWATNNDGGGKAGYTAPRVEGQEEVIREALALAGVDPATVGYVETHGTATPLGDPIEVEALRRAFAAGGPAPGAADAAEDGRRTGPTWLGSLKGNLGHLDAAAGVAGLIKAVLAVERGVVPPSLHFQRPNPHLGLDADDAPFAVAGERRDWRPAGHPRRAGVSSFGIGGTNAHVVLEEPPAVPPRAPVPGPHLLVLSAAAEEALEESSRRLAEHLRRHPGADLDDVAHTLRSGRRALAHRRAVLAADAAQAAERLVGDGAASAGGSVSGSVSGVVPSALPAAGGAEGGAEAAVSSRPSVVFLFPGQGAQHPGMAAGLYAREPVFRRAVDRCAEVLAPIYDAHPGLELAWALPPSPSPADAGAAALAGRRLAHTALAQPAVFTVSWALAELWASWGVVPEAMLGHSIGEYVAACRAGVFRLEDALRVVAARGLLMADLPRGAMLAVPMAAAELAPRLAAVDPTLVLAADNAPGACVASGPAAAIGELARRLAADGVEARRLHTSHAFHSPLVEAAVEPFRRRVAEVELAPPRVPFPSNVTGTWITDAEATDPAYWARHLRSPVAFRPAVEELLGDPGRVFVEVGPGTGLSGLVRRFPEGRSRVAVASSPHPKGLAKAARAAAEEGGAGGGGAEALEAEVMLAAAGRLFVAGLPAPAAAFGERPRRRVPLPTYPFGGDRHWIERAGPGEVGVAPAGPGAVTDAAAAGGIAKEENPEDWFYLPSWRRLPPAGVVAARAGDAGDGEASHETPTTIALVGGGRIGDRLAAELERRGEPVARIADHGGLGDDAGSGGARRIVWLGLAGRPASATDGGEAVGGGETLRGGGEPVAGDGEAGWSGEAGDEGLEPEPGNGGGRGDRLARRHPGPAVADGDREVAGDGAPIGMAEEARAAASGLLELVRRVGPGETILTVVSDGLFEVAGEPVARPGRAAAAGLARVLAQETPGLECHWVDLPAGGGTEADVAGLAAEVVAAAARSPVAGDDGAVELPPIEPLVALRGGRRWAQVFDRVPLAAALGEEGAASLDRRPGLRAGGRYLVLGGAGPFGTALAAHLLGGLGARVLLADRRDLDADERAALDDLVSARAREGAGDADGGGAVGATDGAGSGDGGAGAGEDAGVALDTPPGEPSAAALEVLTGDVTDPDFVDRLLATAAERWGGLDGVVLAAGAPAGDYRPLADVGGDHLEVHLAPKVGAATVLAERLAVRRAGGPSGTAAADRPTFVVATSSLTPVLGGVGLGLHAAADAALDAFFAAASARGASTPAWLSVGWDVWDQPFSGLLAGGSAERRDSDPAVDSAGTTGAASLVHTLGLQQAALAMSADEVILSLGRALALAGEGRVMVATGDLPARVRQWAQGTRPRRAAGGGRRDSDVPYRAPRDAVEERVVAIWSEVLGVPEVGIDDDFFLLGGDSLAGLQVLSKMRSELDVELPLESFFEARTVAGMADVIAAERRRGEEEERRMAELLAEIESLPDDEVRALLEEEA